MKTASSTTTDYFYDPSGRLIQEYTPATGVGKDYLYLDGAPLARVDWSIAETDIGTVLDVSKSGSNAHLDWSAYSSSGSDSFLVRRKLVDPNDKSFDGSQPIATLPDATKTYNDPVLGNGNRYDYRVSKYTRSDTLRFYHTDHLGTPILMTDGSGTSMWQAEVLPFGELPSISGSVENNVRFPGQYFDAETGLDQNWFRDYSAKNGRYVESDPIGLNGSLNTYGYANASPASYYDFLGLQYFRIGIEPPIADAIGDDGALHVLTDPGHTFAYLVDSKGKVVSIFSVGPSTPIGMSNKGDFFDGKLPARANWHIQDPIDEYEWKLTPEQYDSCLKFFQEAIASPGNYTPSHQCTSAAIELGRKCGVDLPSGISPVSIPPNLSRLQGYHGNESNPYGLQQQLNRNMKPKRVKASQIQWR